MLLKRSKIKFLRRMIERHGFIKVMAELHGSRGDAMKAATTETERVIVHRVHKAYFEAAIEIAQPRIYLKGIAGREEHHEDE